MATLNYRRRRVKVEAIVWDGANLREAFALLEDAIETYDRRTGAITVRVGEDLLAAFPDMWLIVDEDENVHPPTTNAIFERLYEPIPDAPA